MSVSIALVALTPSARVDAGSASRTVLTVDAEHELGAVNRDLVGLGWHPGGPPLATVAAVEPRMVRIDAALQDVSPNRGELHLGPLLEHVADIRGIGAEPLVILSYMPVWLGAPVAFGRDPTRVAPAAALAWEELIHDVVLALATAPAPAVRFEAWNEPDIPLFWQDTPVAWSSMIAGTARAIARVEAETGVDLAFAGPATAVPDPLYLAAFLAPLRDGALPLDLVTWHYYANTPFLGPDGNEFGALAALHPVLGQRNPLAGPAVYGPQVDLMRTWTDALLAGSDRPAPPLAIDEWNLSPGGFDRRHDTHEGAAFVAATLSELQRAGLDESALFQADDEAPPGGETSYGGHGVVHHDGTLKPAWWALWLWQRQAGQRLTVDGGDPGAGLWATAACGDGRVTVLVASFSALQPRAWADIELVINGLSWEPTGAVIRRLDATHPDATPEPIEVADGRVRFDLPAQSVVFVELSR